MGHMINSAFMFEDIDNEILVCDTASSLVVHLTGAEAAVVRDLLNSQKPIEFTGAEQAIADRLAEAGVVVEVDPGEPTSDFSRRKMLQLSAVGAAAAGLTVLALPTAAAAASGSGYPPPGPTIPSLPDGANPGATFLGLGGTSDPIEVRWRSTTATAFSYVWAVYSENNEVLGAGTATSGVNNTGGDLVNTGVTAATGQIVRFFVGSQVIDRPVNL